MNKAIYIYGNANANAIANHLSIAPLPLPCCLVRNANASSSAPTRGGCGWGRAFLVSPKPILPLWPASWSRGFTSAFAT
jgi:hypothetical protein